jgi:PAS domain S-box-containing protein
MLKAHFVSAFSGKTFMAKETPDKPGSRAKESSAPRARVAERKARREEDKRKAEALQDSERRFRQLAAASSEGVVISEAGKILYVNERFARMVGYKRGELLGKPVLDLVFPEDRALVKKRVAEGYEERYEHRTVRRDGTVLTVEVRGKPIPYEGRTVRVTAVADVTERRRADEALRASEERYRRLFEAAQDGIVILDAASGEIVDANPYITEILGYSPKELLGRKLWDIGFLADALSSRAAFAELQRAKYIRYDDLPLRAKDGRTVEAEFVSNVYPVGSADVIQCNIRDITARKSAERARAEAETRLRAVITNTPVILYAMDREGTITLFEGKGAFEAGYKPGELVGLNFFEDFADQPYLLECVRRALAGKEHDCTIPGRRGRLFDMRFTPVRDEKKRVVGATAVGVDITAAVEAEKAIQKSEAEMAAIFRGTPVIMALADEELRVRKLNRDGASFAGRPEAKVVGGPVGEVLRCLHALDDPKGCGFAESCAACAVRAAGRESLQTGREIRQRPATFEASREGVRERLSFLVSATPLTAAEEKAVLLTLEDVTALERARAGTASLLAASRAVLGQDRFPDAARAIFERAKEALGADNGFLTLISPEGILLEESYLDVGSGQCDIELPAVNYIHGLRAEVARTQKAAYENDFPDSHFRGLLPEGHMPISNVLVAPLVAAGETVGLLALGNKAGGFTDDDLAPATAFADLAAIALQKFRAQDRLAASEARYRFAEEAANVGTFERDFKTNRVYFSPVAGQLFGFARGDLDAPRENVFSRIHPDDAGILEAAIRRAVETGERIKTEYRVVWPDGTVRWLRVNAEAVRNAAGEAERTAGIIQDVTEEKEAADKLAGSESRLREIVDTAFATIVLVDDGRVVYSNKRIAEIFGYDVAEADGLPFTAFFPPGEGERVLELLGPETEYEGEHRGAKKDGTPMWLRVRGWPLEYGGTTVRVVYLLDITPLREALGGARASEERYALAQRAADIGSWDWDITTGGLVWSDAIEPMFGFGPGEFPGTYEAFLASVHPDDRDLVVAAVDAAVKEKQDYDIEHRVVRPDGRVRWVSEKGEVFYDAGDKPVRMLGVVRDVTARKEVQENLKRALAELAAGEERYRRIVETAEEGIWMVDENNATVFVNRKMAAMLGYTEGELLGEPFLKYVDAGPPPDRGEESRRRGVVEQRDLKLRRRDGDTLWGFAVMSPIFDEGGRYDGALMMVTDITERKNAEDALREAELRYRSLFEQSPDGILVLDPATLKPQEFNETAARQLGYTLEEFAALPVYEYEALETAEETQAHLQKLLRSGRDDFETQHRTKSGEVLSVFVTTKVATIDGRQVLYTTYRDLTPLKRAEEQLVATAAELARSNRDLEQFAYAASHDLREPLRMVSSYLQLLEKRYGDRLDGDAKEFLNYAADGARRMAEMVQDLLDYARVGSRGKPFEPTDLNAVLDQALADVKVAVEETGARVTRDELPTVSADAAQMRQLFENLLSNAVKFRGAEPPAIRVGAERRDGEWRLFVRDNGIGLPPEFRERIFGVFQRLHGPGQYPGTGIGLAVCKKILSRHGGRIWAESEPGRGATFYFTLPAREDER